jgi:F0F1-type ATP synthase delta subunit
MVISSKKLAKALFVSLLSGTAPTDLAKSFDKYLEMNHLRGLRPKVLEHLELELKDYENKNALLIKTSHEISPGIVKTIEKFTGKDEKDRTNLEIEESLIGGFKAFYRGRVYDGSVKNYLQELREALAK